MATNDTGKMILQNGKIDKILQGNKYLRIYRVSGKINSEEESWQAQCLIVTTDLDTG